MIGLYYRKSRQLSIHLIFLKIILTTIHNIAFWACISASIIVGEFWESLSDELSTCRNPVSISCRSVKPICYGILGIQRAGMVIKGTKLKLKSNPNPNPTTTKPNQTTKPNHKPPPYPTPNTTLHRSFLIQYGVENFCLERVNKPTPTPTPKTKFKPKHQHQRQPQPQQLPKTNSLPLPYPQPWLTATPYCFSSPP